MNPFNDGRELPLDTRISTKKGGRVTHEIPAIEAIRGIINTDLKRDPNDGQAYRNIAIILYALGYRARAETCVSGSLFLTVSPELVDMSGVSHQTLDQAVATNPDVRKIAFHIRRKIEEYASSKSFDGACPEILKGRRAKAREFFVAEFTNGRCLIGNVGYAIFDSRGTYVTDFCGNDGKLIGASDPTHHPEVLHLPGTAAFLAHAYSNGHFHWVLETLPRLSLFNAAQHDVRRIDHLITRPLYPYQVDMLRKLGIPESKLVFSNEHAHISADKLLVTSNVEQYFPDQEATDIEIDYWICNYIATNLRPIKPPERKYGKYIYISRDKGANRSFVNAEEVSFVLDAYGFSTVFFEDLTVEEKFACLSEAEVVFSIAGAGLSYIPFCKKGAKIIVAYMEKKETNSFWTLANNCELEHYHILCTAEKSYFPRDIKGKTRITQNYYINIEQLRATLECVLPDALPPRNVSPPLVLELLSRD